MTTITYTCHFCHRGFETEMPDDVAKEHPTMRPNVCNECDERSLEKLTLGRQDVEAAELVRNLAFQDKQKTIEHWQRMAEGQEQVREGIPRSMSSRKAVRRLELMTQIATGRADEREQAPSRSKFRSKR